MDVRLVGAVQRADLGDVHTALGEGAGLVQTDHVDPGQALDGRQLLHQALLAAEPDDADREGDRGEQDQALGDHRDDAADRAGHRLLEVVLLDDQLADDEPDRRRHHHPGHVLEDRADAAAELGLDEGEAGRLLGELGGVRLAADLGGGERPASGDDEAARHHRVAGPLDHRVCLAGQQRLVDLQAVGLGDRAVDDGLVPGAQLDQVAEDDLRDGDLGGGPVAPYGRFGLADHREAVQGLLGAPLLDDADPGVGDDHEAEEAVLDRRDEQHDHPEHADDQVEPGEDVRADDLGDGAGRADRYVVDLAAGDPLGDLGGRQPARWRGRLRGLYGVRLLTGGIECPLRHDSDRTGGREGSPAGNRKFRPGEDRNGPTVVRAVDQGAR